CAGSSPPASGWRSIRRRWWREPTTRSTLASQASARGSRGMRSSRSASICPRTGNISCSSSVRAGSGSARTRARNLSTLEARVAERLFVLELVPRIRVPGQVEHLVEDQAVRGRGRACQGAVATLEQRGQRTGVAAAVADFHERPDDGAHHVLEEGGRLHGELEARPVLPDLEPAHLSHGGARRAIRRTECREVVHAEKRRGSPHKRSMPLSNSCCTLRPFGCICQPTKSVPSYSSVSLRTVTSSRLAPSRSPWTASPRRRTAPAGRSGSSSAGCHPFHPR